MDTKKRSGRVTVIATVLGIALITIVIASGAAGGASSPLSSVSTEGVSLASGEAQVDADALAKLGRPDGNVMLLATRGNRAYYRIDAVDRPTCYGVGSSAELGVLGQVRCGTDFPSETTPVLAFNVFHGRTTATGSADVTIYRSEGIAADGVGVVSFVNASGERIVSASVSNNVFSFSGIPSTPRALIALDDHGHILYRQGVAATVIRDPSQWQLQK